MARTDIHRPSAIVPADYHYVGIECQKIEGMSDVHAVLENRERIHAHMERTGGTYSHHAHGGSCHICGAHAIYTVLFYHKPTNVYVRTGMDCADKLEWDSGEGEAFRKQLKDVMNLRAGKAKAKAVLERDGLADAWGVYEGSAIGREEMIVRDMVGKLIQYGSLSEKQNAFLARLLDTIKRRPEIEAQRKAETEAAKPVPVNGERITVTGKVLSIRCDDFGVKTLIQHADGWKVWGSLPLALDSAKVGDNVEFSATVKVSEKDPKFGYFSRPTKARAI